MPNKIWCENMSDNTDNASQTKKTKQARGNGLRSGQTKRLKYKRVDLGHMTEMRYMHQRACGLTYQVFRVNAFEIDLLLSLHAHSERLNKMIVPKGEFFNQLTGNTKRKAKYEGFLWGLRRLGLVGSYEYIHRPGSLCIGISEIGWKAIQYYKGQLERLINRVDRQKRFEGVEYPERPEIIHYRSLPDQVAA